MVGRQAEPPPALGGLRSGTPERSPPMAVIAPLFALAVASLPALQAVGPGFVRWSAAELERRNAALSEAIRLRRVSPRDPGRLRGRRVPSFPLHPPRGKRISPSSTRSIEDVVLIQSGAATLVVGGELVDPTGRDGEYRGTDIAGGMHYPGGPRGHRAHSRRHPAPLPRARGRARDLRAGPAAGPHRRARPAAGRPRPGLRAGRGSPCGGRASSTGAAPTWTGGSAPTARPARPSPTTAARPARTASATSTATPTGCPRSTTTSSTWSS